MKVIQLSSYLHPKKISVLGSRLIGKNLRDDIERVLSEPSSVVLDFSDIDIMTQSFCDEAIGVLIRERSKEVLKNIAFKNANPSIRRTILLVKDYSEKMGMTRSLKDIVGDE